MEQEGLHSTDTTGIQRGFQGFSQPTSTSDEKSLVDAIGSYINPQLTKENEHLKRENEELKAQHEKDRLYMNTCADQAVEIEEYKKKLKEAQDKIKLIEKKNTQTTNTPKRNYHYNICDFGKDATEDDVHELFDTLVFIANETMPDNSYIMDCTMMAIIPIFILLTDESIELKNTHWLYYGTMKDFCLYWNQNVVPYIEDKKRAKSMTCSIDTFKAEYNKRPWKNASPVSWYNMFMGGGRYKKPLMRAVNIGKRLAKRIGK